MVASHLHARNVEDVYLKRDQEVLLFGTVSTRLLDWVAPREPAFYLGGRRATERLAWRYFAAITLAVGCGLALVGARDRWRDVVDGG